MSDNRSWVSVEIAGDKLGCNAVKVRSLIRAGRLQGKRDSFGGTLVSAVSIQAAAGGVQLRGVR